MATARLFASTGADSALGVAVGDWWTDNFVRTLGMGGLLLQREPWQGSTLQHGGSTQLSTRRGTTPHRESRYLASLREQSVILHTL